MDSQSNDQKNSEILVAIQYHAAMLHGLIRPGATVDILLQEKSAIITPGSPRIVGRLIVTRPQAVLQIKP